MSPRDRGWDRGSIEPSHGATVHGHSNDRGSATVSHSQPQSIQWLAEWLAKKERTRALRAELAIARKAGKERRHQARLNNQRPRRTP